MAATSVATNRDVGISYQTIPVIIVNRIFRDPPRYLGFHFSFHMAHMFQTMVVFVCSDKFIHRWSPVEPKARVILRLLRDWF